MPTLIELLRQEVRNIPDNPTLLGTYAHIRNCYNELIIHHDEHETLENQDKKDQIEWGTMMHLATQRRDSDKKKRALLLIIRYLKELETEGNIKDLALSILQLYTEFLNLTETQFENTYDEERRKLTRDAHIVRKFDHFLEEEAVQLDRIQRIIKRSLHRKKALSANRRIAMASTVAFVTRRLRDLAAELFMALPTTIQWREDQPYLEGVRENADRISKEADKLEDHFKSMEGQAQTTESADWCSVFQGILLQLEELIDDYDVKLKRLNKDLEVHMEYLDHDREADISLVEEKKEEFEEKTHELETDGEVDPDSILGHFEEIDGTFRRSINRTITNLGSYASNPVAHKIEIISANEWLTTMNSEFLALSGQIVSAIKLMASQYPLGNREYFENEAQGIEKFSFTFATISQSLQRLKTNTAQKPYSPSGVKELIEVAEQLQQLTFSASVRVLHEDVIAHLKQTKFQKPRRR